MHWGKFDWEVDGWISKDQELHCFRNWVCEC